MSVRCCDSKETVWLPIERLLQTHSTFSKSVMVAIGVSRLGQMDPIFIDFKVEINGTCYHEVLLTQKLLPVMREICGEFFIFQQGNVPAHRACKTINLRERDTCVHFTRPFVTQQHSFLNPVSYKIWGKCSSGSRKFITLIN